MHIRRIARATNAFSKKLVNFRAAVALHYCYYNFCKHHITIGTTPAVAAGVTDHVWSIPELIENAPRAFLSAKWGFDMQVGPALRHRSMAFAWALLTF
jgi:hypothetical protein